MKKTIYHDNNVVEVILYNEHLKVHLINVGASIFKLIFNDVDVLVGPKNLNDFIKPDHYYGKTVGRFCGRLPIKFNQQKLNEVTLKPYKSSDATIHGGANGFSTRTFNYLETNEDEAVFTLLQKEEDDNLPGDVTLTVKYELKNSSLKVSYLATSTKQTILNITNHAYFNLNNDKTVLDHELKISADKFVLFDDFYNIKGLKETENTIYDFKDYVKIKKPLSYLENTAFKGLDTIFILNEEKEVNLNTSKNKTNLKITTSYPSVVVYTHNSDSPDGLDYYKLWPYAGVALECLYEPGGTLTNFLSDSILKEKETYNHYINYKFTKK